MRAIRIFDDGDGTITVKHDPSLNTLAPMAAGELARINVDTDGAPAVPDCDPRYWAWSGSKIVEADQATKDAVDVAIAAQAAASLDAAKKAARDQLANDPLLATIAETLIAEIADRRGVTQKQVRDAMLAKLEGKINA